MYEIYFIEWIDKLAIPLLLSTQLMCVFDTDIQVIFGRITLCAKLYGDSRDNVVVGICSVPFALFLKARCFWELLYDKSQIAITVHKNVFDLENSINEINDNSLILVSALSSVLRLTRPLKLRFKISRQ